MPAENWTDEAELTEGLNIRRLSLGSHAGADYAKSGDSSTGLVRASTGSVVPRLIWVAEGGKRQDPTINMPYAFSKIYNNKTKIINLRYYPLIAY
jgi:hypothetical protein